MNERHLTFGILFLSTVLFFTIAIASNPLYAIVSSVGFFIFGCGISIASQRMHDSHLSRLFALLIVTGLTATIITLVNNPFGNLNIALIQ